MEMENKILQEDVQYEAQEQLQENEDAKQSKYVVATVRDKQLLKTFVKFYNRVKHPRVTVYNLVVGGTLVALPSVQGAMKQPGTTICYVVGIVMLLLALFRHHISIYMMKSNEETKYNASVTYFFGSTAVQVEESGEVSRLGNYKKIYCVWEDEKNFFLGMNEDDLVVLPKKDFTTGDAATFRDFILDKSRAEFRWKPAELKNVIRDKMMNVMFKKEEEK